MNERIKALRQTSIETKASLSPERAKLLTEFYRTGVTDQVAIPVARALAFKYLLENKKLYIGEGELIVGERGPEPKATPTYPELCTHSLNDLEILHNREKISFSVAVETRKLYQDTLIPFWKGKSIRDKIFEEVDEEWKSAYKAGIFTEFMEQRAPGHTVLDDKIYQKGFLDFISDIKIQINKLDFCHDLEALEKREELLAMQIAAEALIAFAGRYAGELKKLAKVEKQAERKAELEKMSEICEWVPANKPRTFWEALQYYWFVHLSVTTELTT